MVTKKEKKISLNKFLIVIIISIFLVIIILTSPIFQVKNIIFEGGEKYSREEIMSKIGITDRINIFMVRPKYSKRFLEKNYPYIKSATIDLKYPSQVSITIKERKVRGYVPYMGSYLYINEEGRVLSVDTKYTEKLPLVEGLDFSEFQVGEILKVKNQKSFDVVVKTANMMIKYQSEYDEVKDIVKIDVNDPENIHIYIRQIDFLLGDLTNYDYKMRVMLTAIKEIPEKDRGSLDLRNTDKNTWIWQYLT